MKLKVWVPSEVLLEEEVTKVKAEAENGWFCLLPRHIDFVTALVPGVLTFELPGGKTEYLAIDHGVLVKCGPEVSVSTRSAVRSADLGTLKERVVRQFRMLEEKEKGARGFEAKLEADLVRQLIEHEKYARP
jgi:F-type H+-transporting ATPase subunit epsilon